MLIVIGLAIVFSVGTVSAKGAGLPAVTTYTSHERGGFPCAVQESCALSVVILVTNKSTGGRHSSKAASQLATLEYNSGAAPGHSAPGI